MVTYQESYPSLRPEGVFLDARILCLQLAPWHTPEPCKFVTIQFTYIIQTKAQHSDPFNASAPREHWVFDAKRLCNFWPENSHAKELDPFLQFFIVDHTLQRRFCIWKERGPKLDTLDAHLGIEILLQTH